MAGETEGVSADAFAKALAVQRNASGKGLDWPDPYGVLTKIREELGEAEAVIRSGSRTRFNDEVGDLLFSVVNLARMLDVDPEGALIEAINKFESRFREVLALARRSGQEVERMSIEELDLLWEEAKRSGSHDSEPRSP
jgi:uncharacterized protein YabN with tetrapyrrole methylase and pyrophosphatase domain